MDDLVFVGGLAAIAVAAMMLDVRRRRLLTEAWYRELRARGFEPSGRYPHLEATGHQSGYAVSIGHTTVGSGKYMQVSCWVKLSHPTAPAADDALARQIREYGLRAQHADGVIRVSADEALSPERLDAILALARGN